MKDYTALKNWNDDYNGAAIYSIVDRNGKRYIGQAKHLQQRLDAHRQALNKAYKGIDVNVIENQNLVNAARNGETFSVEILYKIPWYKASRNMLRYYEKYYLDKYGGYKNTYNIAPVYAPNFNYMPYNEITLGLELDADIIEYLGSMDNVQGFIKNLIRSYITQNK